MKNRKEAYGSIAQVFRIVSVFMFVLGMMLLTKRYGVPWWEAFLIIATPAMLTYLEGLTRNLKKNLKK